MIATLAIKNKTTENEKNNFYNNCYLNHVYDIASRKKNHHLDVRR